MPSDLPATYLHLPIDGEVKKRAAAQAAANRRLVIVLLGLLMAATAFAFALIPLYRVFCEISGFNNSGQTLRSGVDDVPGAPFARVSAQMRADTRASAPVLAATQHAAMADIRLDLLGTVMPGLPWTARPRVSQVSVRPGELTTIYYEVRNLSDHPVLAQAVPSFSPSQVARHFRKVDCFCFSTQRLAPHESRALPVTFIVSPQFDGNIRQFTLAYAFFPEEPKS